MKLPDSEYLDIGHLSRILDRKRVTNCYKYFWTLAILHAVSFEKTAFTYNDLLNGMIKRAWYMVTEFNLTLGPCNVTDNLEEVVKYISSTYNIPPTAKEKDILKFLENNDDKTIIKHKRDLIRNVPYRLQSPFYSNIKDLGEKKINEINQQKHLLYYFKEFNKLKTVIEISDEWVEYLVRNKEILTDWVYFNLINYLQARNPNVPGISDKLKRPEKRDLAKVTEYWKTIITLNPTIKDIYGNINMQNEKMSIDHFVPWQYVAHDELWNLSPTTPSINSKKGNKLPNWDDYYKELAELEYKAYTICHTYDTARKQFEKCAERHINSQEVRSSLYADGLDLEQFSERLCNILKPVYDSAKLCGFDELELEITFGILDKIMKSWYNVSGTACLKLFYKQIGEMRNEHCMFRFRGSIST